MGLVVTAETLAAVFRRFRKHTARHREALNLLNVYPVPDGDTGTNLALTATAITSELEGASTLDEVCDAVAHGSLMGARGNSGVILSQILRGFTDRLREGIDGRSMAGALRDGAEAAYSSVLRPQEGTMLTVIREAAQAAERAASPGATVPGVLAAAYTEGEVALRGTPEQLPELADAGVVDAGGAGVLLLLAALWEEVGGGSPTLPEDLFTAVPTAAVSVSQEEQFEIALLLDAGTDEIGELRRAWDLLGNSVVIIGGPGTYKCHIHTSDVEAAVEAARAVGQPREITITDLSESFQARPEILEAEVGVVAVVEGRGLIELFHQLGAQSVVRGGAGLNPSVAELEAAVEAAPAETLVVLPNHRDVLPAARRLNQLTSKHIEIVPTASVMEGLAAMVAYRPEDESQELIDRMTAASKRVGTGQIARANRAGSDHESGDWIGIASGEVVATGVTRADALVSLCALIVPADAELVTIVVGLEGDDETTGAAQTWINENRPHTVAEIILGEQPVYAYYVAVE